MADLSIKAWEIREAINDSCYGRSGKNVFGRDTDLVWRRIVAVRARGDYAYGKSLNTGNWFLIVQWEVR